jgi:hypothetical protein
MKLQPRNHFTDTVIKIKQSLNIAREDIKSLKERYDNIAINKNLTENELRYLKHFDKLDSLLAETENEIVFMNNH